MKYLHLFICSISLVLLASCSGQPEADFTWEPQNPKAFEQVRFINLSTGANRFSWNLGNMGISQEENPTTVFIAEGNYIIDLVASKGARSDERTITIRVSR